MLARRSRAPRRTSRAFRCRHRSRSTPSACSRRSDVVPSRELRFDCADPLDGFEEFAVEATPHRPGGRVRRPARRRARPCGTPGRVVAAPHELCQPAHPGPDTTCRTHATAPGRGRRNLRDTGLPKRPTRSAAGCRLRRHNRCRRACRCVGSCWPVPTGDSAPTSRTPGCRPSRSSTVTCRS